MLVVVVNAGQVPVRVGSARLAFLTYKDASPLPCSGASEPIVLPETLAPGAMELVRAPVACAPSNEGRYEIVGRLALEGEESIEVGRIVVRVTRDPRLFAPEPWPSWGERPSGGWTR